MIVALLVILAAPKFDTSTIAASRSTVFPLETIDYTITVRNTGDRAPSYLRVANAIPNSAMFAGASPEWEFIEADRELSWMGTLPPGDSKVLTLSVVTRPESSGLTLANRAAIHYDGAYWAVDHDLQIDTPPSKSNATIYILGYLGLGGVVLLMFRRASVWLIVLAVGFLLIFVDVARRDHRVNSKFVETRCTILDSMARYQESQAANPRKRRVKTWSPLFAVRYKTTDGDRVSVGFASESRLQFGSPGPTQAALASLPRGGAAPCWYDPEEPQRVVLTRGWGGAYGFALLPLAALAVGVWMERRRRAA